MDRLDAPKVAGAAGDRLRAGLDTLIAKHDLPYVTYNFGSIVQLLVPAGQHYLRRSQHPGTVPGEQAALHLRAEENGTAD